MPDPIYITGPTASGKSALALSLARRVGGEIVNADAFQLYRGLDILTAKPSPAERSAVPHHLYDVLDLSEACDAHRYRELALPVIADIRSRGALPIIVGGSGLYVKALTHGFSDLPKGDAAMRERLAHFSLHEKVTWLLRLDPKAEETVALANPRYVERALEICLISGQPQSELRCREKSATTARGIRLIWDRAQLYERINQRVLRMMEADVANEVRKVAGFSVTSERAIGVREILDWQSGRISEQEAVEMIQQATRRYAKRQITWFKRERWLQTICLTPETTAESALDSLLSLFPDLAT
jgi:tRNA dimethylallyltransferase